MTLYIEVLTGPLMGNKYTVFDGLRIGRREGEILLPDDSKVSGLHAKIQKDSKGNLALMDLGSANALVLNERRVKKVALIVGVTFRVGETLMVVGEASSSQPAQLINVKSWQDRVQDYLSASLLKNSKDRSFGQTFTPVVKLDFLQGVQAETSLLCAYGPRTAGAGHLDIDLLDPEAPEKCFRILPGPGVAFLEDHSFGRLLVNDLPPVENQPLTEGDLLRIGGTLIRIGYD